MCSSTFIGKVLRGHGRLTSDQLKDEEPEALLERRALGIGFISTFN